MEGVVIILLFVGVIAVTALIFCVWVIAMVLRLILRGMGTLFMAPRMTSRKSSISVMNRSVWPSATGDSVHCPSDRCRAVNPAGARFCRRCGQALPATHVSATRSHRQHAACW